MLLRKQGLPEEGELVICTVTNVQHHSVFVTMDEYGGKTGLVHISEISPGRIRNIRDYVVEGKKIICKVLRINHERGHIDLSFRRVNEGLRRSKVEQLKKEQKAEKIVEFVAKELKMDVKEVYAQIADKALKKYELLYECFEEAVSKEGILEKLGIPEKITKPLLEAVKQRIKEAEVNIGGKLNITSYDSNGVEIVKEALIKAEKAGKENTQIVYLGAGNYKISIKSSNYKDAENKLEKVTKTAIEFIEEHHGEAKFTREEISQ